MIVRAVVTKLATDDGYVSFLHGHIGKEYLVEINSIRRGQTLVHWHPSTGDDEQVVHQKDIIWSVEGDWLPLECLTLLI